MTTYRTREKYVAEGTEFEMADDGFVAGRRPHLSGVKLLIAEPIEADETYECGHPTDSGTCGRKVDAPGETCWQHE